MYYKLYRNRADIQQYGHLIPYGTNYTGILFNFLQIMQDVVQSFANLVGGLFKVLQIMQDMYFSLDNQARVVGTNRKYPDHIVLQEPIMNDTL